jgi:hypothetical protein
MVDADARQLLEWLVSKRREKTVGKHNVAGKEACN